MKPNRVYIVIDRPQDGVPSTYEFDTLMAAFKFYTQDLAHRRIFREIDVEVKEK